MDLYTASLSRQQDWESSKGLLQTVAGNMLGTELTQQEARKGEYSGLFIFTKQELNYKPTVTG